MANHPLLKPGVTHNEVPRMKRLAKTALTKLNRADIAKPINAETKVYGDAAVKGVKFLQKHYKLDVDGIVGPKTWAMLEKYGTSAPQLTIHSRASWDARTPTNDPVHVEWSSTATEVRIHHTATPQLKTHTVEAEEAAMRSLQNFHMDVRHYNDIGYNYVIFKSGRVYAGRGKEVLGAHTLGHNEDCGVAFYGNYSTEYMTDAQVKALQALKLKLGLKGANVPHSRTFSTSCPGNNVRRKLGI